MRERTIVRSVRLAVVAGAIIILLPVVQACTAPCLGDPARTCIPEAGIAVVLPEGWSVKSAAKDTLFTAAPGQDTSVQVVIESGASIFDSVPPATLDDVADIVPARLSAAGSGFSKVDQPIVDRVVLPIGPAVRIRYTSTTSFIFSYNQAMISDWFFVNGRLMVLEYEVAYGEGPAAMPGTTDPSALQSILSSIRLLGQPAG